MFAMILLLHKTKDCQQLMWRNIFLLTFVLITYKISSLLEIKVQSFGVVAQLVEHLLCKQGVVSSSLISSTKTKGEGDGNHLSK